ncbi:hypothetical protein HDU82_002000 [Entophlyctis luteolus]|nr:hypothetical protein HDU82_002000 [Entophlyctis luteolus]
MSLLSRLGEVLSPTYRAHHRVSTSKDSGVSSSAKLSFSAISPTADSFGRRLVLLFDGTDCKPGGSRAALSQGRIKNASVLAQSNVFATAFLVNAAEDPNQLVYYHHGPGGNDDQDQLKSLKENLLEGFFGNIDDFILDAYSWLSTNYREGDRVYAFGFSRGAVIVRSLFNLIRFSGLLDATSHKLSDPHLLFERINEAYHYYKTIGNSADFKAKFCFPTVNLEFLGLWDTVPSLDIPTGIFPEPLTELMSDVGHMFRLIEENKFHDLSITDSLPYAYHALAMDELSTVLLPMLFENAKTQGWIDRQQNWFRGHHADVGGQDFERGLANLSLEWMLGNARRAGLTVADSREFHDTVSRFGSFGVESSALQRRNACVLHPALSLHLPGEDRRRNIDEYIRRGHTGDGVFYSKLDSSVATVVLQQNVDLGETGVKSV